MKVLHINTNDIDGGAARAAYRIHHGLIANGYLSEMLVQNKNSDDYTVMKTEKNKGEKLINRIIPFADNAIKRVYPKHLNVPWSVNFFNNSKTLDFIRKDEYDIVHLHWINNAFLSISDISKIKKPIVWTLHDTWAFTGGCHYFGECSKYMNQCEKCNQLNSKTNYDLSSFLFKKKYASYEKSDITIVTPSKWLAGCARQSFLLKNKRIEVIPNGIDLNVYKKISKEIARNILNIDNDALVIMFGSISSTSDQRKGYIYLKEALKKLKYRFERENSNKKIQIVIFGAGEKRNEDNLGYPVIYTGHISDDITLSLLYNCADVFVAPSKEDNLPNTIVESLACGTPCVAFDIGGMPDMIEHKKNGYLVKPFDVLDMANGLQYVIEDDNRRKMMGIESRIKAEKEYDFLNISRKYINLYESVLGL